jgi:hypothetical protein
MKTLQTTIALALVSSAAFAQNVIWQDKFDQHASPSTVTTSGNGINGYDIKFGSANPFATTENFTAIFGFDYSTISYPLSIPSAPNSGGSTKGLYLTVNKNPAFPFGAGNTLANGGTNSSVNLYPVGQSFSGDFRVKYDVWMNWTNLSFSTEHALVGINHSGSVTNRMTGNGSDGIFTAMDGDGGASAISTTARDYSLFQGRGALSPLLYRTNNQAFNVLLGTQFDHLNAGFQTLFPDKAVPGYTTTAGMAGLGWVQGEVRQDGNIITWLLDNTIIAQFANTNGYTAGNIMIGYNDLFNSLGDANNFAIFDNIRVEVPEPASGMVGGLALALMTIAHRRRK